MAVSTAKVASPRGAQRSRSPRKLAPNLSVCSTGGSPVFAAVPSPNIDDDLDGFSIEELFANRKNATGYTFDDLICLPGHINFGVQDVCLETHFTRKIKLKVPLVSSPMDTVTESRMAIGMALHGGIGVIHRNMSIEDQAAQVRKVKNYMVGFTVDPICVLPTMTLEAMSSLSERSGCTGFPVTKDASGSELVGLVTRRDMDLLESDPKTTTVADVMTPFAKLKTAEHGIGLAAAKKTLFECKRRYLPIVKKDGKTLTAIVCRDDLYKTAEFPSATKSSDGKLACAASVGVTEGDKDRLRALVAAGVDVIVVDSSQGDNTNQHDILRWSKSEFPALELVGGNVATPTQAKHLIECGLDGLRVGMGIGSLSTVQDVRACGRAQASAVYSICALAGRHKIPVIADGGCDGPGKILKALCMGGSSAMCGSLLAGTEESPGDYLFQDGRRVKRYRGTGSLEGLSKADTADRRSVGSSVRVKVAHGVSGSVVDRGSLDGYMPYLTQSLRHGMQDLGVQSITDLHKQLHNGQLRFEIRSPAAQREGGVHGLHSYEKKLYSLGK